MPAAVTFEGSDKHRSSAGVAVSRIANQQVVDLHVAGALRRGRCPQVITVVMKTVADANEQTEIVRRHIGRAND